MTPPLPPTDNLYKFQAVLGCILVVAGLLGMVYSGREFNDKMDQFWDKQAERELKYLAISQDQSHPLEPYHRREYERFDLYLDTSHKQSGRLLEVSTLVGILGGFIMIRGFKRWGERVQTYQDALLRLEVA